VFGLNRPTPAYWEFDMIRTKAMERQGTEICLTIRDSGDEWNGAVNRRGAYSVPKPSFHRLQ
jgi:hypothetical protein